MSETPDNPLPPYYNDSFRKIMGQEFDLGRVARLASGFITGPSSRYPDWYPESRVTPVQSADAARQSIPPGHIALQGDFEQPTQPPE